MLALTDLDSGDSNIAQAQRFVIACAAGDAVWQILSCAVVALMASAVKHDSNPAGGLSSDARRSIWCEIAAVWNRALTLCDHVCASLCVRESLAFFLCALPFMQHRADVEGVLDLLDRSGAQCPVAVAAVRRSFECTTFCGVGLQQLREQRPYHGEGRDALPFEVALRVLCAYFELSIGKSQLGALPSGQAAAEKGGAELLAKLDHAIVTEQALAKDLERHRRITVGAIGIEARPTRAPPARFAPLQVAQPSPAVEARTASFLPSRIDEAPAATASSPPAAPEQPARRSAERCPTAGTGASR
jgi:hypothetical protein